MAKLSEEKAAAVARAAAGPDDIKAIEEAQRAAAVARAAAGPQEENLTITLMAAERFFRTFERSAKRWELIIYPAMLGLVLLFVFGFYLILNLSSDMQLIANRFDPKMGSNMAILAENMGRLSGNIDRMSKNINTMTFQVAQMADSLKSVDRKMDALSSIDLQMISMNDKMHVMTASMDRMRFDMSVMSRPMSKMNSIIPF